MRILEKGRFSEHISIAGNIMLPSYLVHSKIPVLIDSGMTVMGPVLYEDLKPYHNYPKIYHLLTHSHFDHCGSTPFLLKKLKNMEVMAGAHAVEVLKKESAISLIRSLNEDMEKSLGITDGILNGEKITFEGFPIHKVLKENEVIELGDGVYFEVYEVPGHTRDSLCYRIMPDNAIFAGEAYGVPTLSGKRVYPQFLVSFKDYMNSLKKMRKLEPRWIGLAHGGVIGGDEAISFLEKSIIDSEEFAEMIKERILKEKNPLSEDSLRKIVEEIAEKDYNPNETTQSKRAYMLNLTAMVKTVLRELCNSSCNRV
jgi:glyoxylase-like metal-dependent hydrolase (beta-lactamase superfamily II)